MTSENSLFKVTPHHFNKEILIPTSKSHANRALIMAALKGGKFKIDHLPQSSDVINLVAALKKIGLKIVTRGDSTIFENSFPLCESDTTSGIIDLETGDGGTTNRFLLALLSRGQKTYRLFPSEKMSERPIQDLLSPLRALGVRVNEKAGDAWIEVQGPSQLNDELEIEVDCSKSTQFASALMMAFATENIIIKPVNLEASQAYLQLTKEVIKECTHKSFYNIPVDFSSLSYPLALALVSGKVLIRNCHGIDALQADSVFIELMKSSGADIHWSDRGLLATMSNKLKPFEIDGKDCPDLIPTLAYMASNIAGRSLIRGLKVLIYKESDRLQELLELLNIFQVVHHYDSELDELSITGPTIKSEVKQLIPPRDHRMVMIAYLFLRTHGGGELGHTDCVAKSFPNFFTTME